MPLPRAQRCLNSARGRIRNASVLAAVPGSVYCVRLRSLDGGPHYHSCYDLTSPQALERDEWLTVRNSFSSSRVRPHFLNTRRIMFRTLLDERRSSAFMEHVF